MDDAALIEEGEGLAQERTEMAWNRSGLAVVVVLALLVRKLWPLQGERTVAAVLMIAFGGLCWAASLLAARSARDREPEVAIVQRVFWRVSLGTFVLAVAGFVLGIASPH